MTVNMRDAYADIMGMFSDALPVQAARKKRCSMGGTVRGGAGASAAAAPSSLAFEVFEEEEDELLGGASPAALSPAGAPAAFAAPAAVMCEGASRADGMLLRPCGPARLRLTVLPLRPRAVYQDSPMADDFRAAADDDHAVSIALPPLAMAAPAAEAEALEVYESDGENADPMLPAGALPASPPPPRALDEAAVLQPLGLLSLRAPAAPPAEDEEAGVPEDEAAALAAAEAALRGAASEEALAAQDSFEVYEEGADDAPGAPPVPLEADADADDAAGAAGELLDPFSSEAVAAFLTALDEPVATMQGVTAEDEAAATRLEASLSAARRRPASGVLLQLGGFRYKLGRLCGRGAYADIYEAADEDDDGDDDSGGEPGAAAAPPALALKVVRPPDAAAVAWEYAVLRRVAARVPPAERALFLQARRLHLAGPHAVLVAPFGAHGTLQDAVNASLAADRSGAMPEPLAMYFTVELLRCLETLHAAGFVHADVKPDNLLLRHAPGAAPWEDWAPARPGGWRQRGLALIDFGRALDLSLHAPGAAFVGDCRTENFRCVEMQTGAPWTFQADTFGALGCVSVMLWGSYLEVDQDEATGRWRRRAPLKRYWRTELWEPLFDALLNVPSCDAQPDLRTLRAAFEAYLAAPERARDVRTQLMALTIRMHELAASAA